MKTTIHTSLSSHWIVKALVFIAGGGILFSIGIIVKHFIR